MAVFDRSTTKNTRGLSVEFGKQASKCLEEALIWIDANQLGRRNLTDEERAYVIGRLYESMKRRGKRTDLHQKQTTSQEGEHIVKNGAEHGLNLSPCSVTNFTKGDHATARNIAHIAKVGQATVRRAADFATALEKVEAISPETKKAILEGRVNGALTVLPKAFQPFFL